MIIDWCNHSLHNWCGLFPNTSDIAHSFPPNTISLSSSLFCPSRSSDSSIRDGRIYCIGSISPNSQVRPNIHCFYGLCFHIWNTHCYCSSITSVGCSNSFCNTSIESFCIQIHYGWTKNTNCIIGSSWNISHSPIPSCLSSIYSMYLLSPNTPHPLYPNSLLS